MKNEWDMLALVEQRLAAGQQLITFSYGTRWLVEPDGSPGRVHDEEGVEYEIGADFLPGVVPVLRAHAISFALDNWHRTLRFGPGLPASPGRYVVQGQAIPVVDLTPGGPAVLVALLITSSQPAGEDGEELPPDDEPTA
ncbi:hypothetical protein LGH70_01950 [Hymenobacter sp. BT635]|uniref:Uncharacterized protein n=1 Tax=Hymenobacter nitidus TaxID=2880929 RepID=A0ABS8A8U5_9BACT|nr:hypothetical protein [Hymenobacter nitidus]MCB2376327.1 hypothetical protein [Hymenobacter nitidus]